MSGHGLIATGPLRRPLSALSALIVLLGLAAELGDYVFGWPGVWVETFSLSYEANLPTWYATVLLFSASALLFDIGSRADGPRRWRVLGGIFAYMSLDEAIEIHEHLGWLVHGEGVFYYGWVIPASLITALIGLYFLPFLRALPELTRRRFVLAGLVYVGGALAMEAPLGYWAERNGSDNLGYGLIDLVEESLELVGLNLFVLALLAERRRAS